MNNRQRNDYVDPSSPPPPLQLSQARYIPLETAEALLHRRFDERSVRQSQAGSSPPAADESSPTPTPSPPSSGSNGGSLSVTPPTPTSPPATTPALPGRRTLQQHDVENAFRIIRGRLEEEVTASDTLSPWGSRTGTRSVPQASQATGVAGPSGRRQRSTRGLPTTQGPPLIYGRSPTQGPSRTLEPYSQLPDLPTLQSNDVRNLLGNIQRGRDPIGTGRPGQHALPSATGHRPVTSFYQPTFMPVPAPAYGRPPAYEHPPANDPPSTATPKPSSSVTRAPPGLPPPSPTNILPRSMNHPPDYPVPSPGFTLRPHDPRPTPHKFAIIELHTLPNHAGTSFLLRSVENGGLWTGTTSAPLAYFEQTKNYEGNLLLRDFRCGNAAMRGVSDNFFFPKYVPTWKIYMPGKGDDKPVRLALQEMLRFKEFESADPGTREACRERLENEIKICEKLRSFVNGCPFLTPYEGVVVDEKGGHVQAVAYGAYRSTLPSFVQDEKHLRSHQAVERIVFSVKQAVQYLHSVDIVHGKVVAENVYLNYSLLTVAGEERLEAHIHAVVLGGYTHAMDCTDVNRVSPSQRLAGRLSDWEHVNKLEEWLESELQDSDWTDLALTAAQIS